MDENFREVVVLIRRTFLFKNLVDVLGSIVLREAFTFGGLLIVNGVMLHLNMWSMTMILQFSPHVEGLHAEHKRNASKAD